MSDGVIWKEAEIRGRRCMTGNLDDVRLYLTERWGRVEAWVDDKLIGKFSCFDDAKLAATGFTVPHETAAKPQSIERPDRYPRVKPKNTQATARAYVTKYPPPNADVTVPSPHIKTIKLDSAEGQELLVETWKRSATATGACRCGAPLGRSGKCPALCEPVPAPPPAYTGPPVVGSTHVGRMTRPEFGWIG